MGESLWTDEHLLIGWKFACDKPPTVGQFALLRQVRDDYAARLAELEQERDALRAQVGEWQPVYEKISCMCGDERCGGYVRSEPGNDWGHAALWTEQGNYHLLWLPDDIRLCRLVESAREDVPAEICKAIGYCWRWAQTWAEKGGADTNERYQFMCDEIDKIVIWLEQQEADNAR